MNSLASSGIQRIAGRVGLKVFFIDGTVRSLIEKQGLASVSNDINISTRVLNNTGRFGKIGVGDIRSLL